MIRLYYFIKRIFVKKVMDQNTFYRLAISINPKRLPGCEYRGIYRSTYLGNSCWIYRQYEENNLDI
jgi:hypothetical protein